MDHRRLTGISSRQDGLFTVGQARDCGLAASTLHRWRREGRLTLAQAGVYAWPAPFPWERALRAALLAAGPAAVASHRSAGRLWGLTDPRDQTLEMTVPASRRPKPRGAIVHRGSDLVEAHVTLKKGFPVTNPLRVMVDLGAVLPAEQVEDALDRGLVSRLFSVGAVEGMLHELGRQGRRGAGVLGRVLDERALGAAPPDGMLEPRMARLLQAAGQPRPDFQFPIIDRRGRLVARVDFAYPHRRLAIEVDGWAVHGSAAAMERDFIRQNGLLPHGWRVLRFTWRQVVRRPGEVAAAVVEALEA